MAIKQIDLYSISNENISSIEGEINLLKNLDHLNIVKYIECIRTKTHINLVLEYVENGSLHQMVKQSGKMGEHLVFIFVKQILEGLAYLHNQGIIHRDIKGANLLLTKNGVVKLADFGYSILNDKNKVNSIVGTACFMAPEVIEQKGNISPKCDIWSLGSTIIQLLTTRPPYYEFEPMAAMFRIVTDDCPPLPSGISEHLKNFLLKCFLCGVVANSRKIDLLFVGVAAKQFYHFLVAACNGVDEAAVHSVAIDVAVAVLLALNEESFAVFQVVDALYNVFLNVLWLLHREECGCTAGLHVVCQEVEAVLKAVEA